MSETKLFFFVITNHLFACSTTLVSLDSLHCKMKFLCLLLICKVEAYLMVLCKHSKSTLNQLKNCDKHVAHKQGHLHLQGNCGRTFELQCIWMGCTAPAPTVTLHAVFKIREGWKERKIGNRLWTDIKVLIGTPIKIHFPIVLKGNCKLKKAVTSLREVVCWWMWVGGVSLISSAVPLTLTQYSRRK